MDPKNILQSKTFWLNLALLAANYSGALPTKYAVPIGTAANIAVRVLTNQPVTVFPPLK